MCEKVEFAACNLEKVGKVSCEFTLNKSTLQGNLLKYFSLQWVCTQVDYERDSLKKWITVYMRQFRQINPCEKEVHLSMLLKRVLIITEIVYFKRIYLSVMFSATLMDFNYYVILL